MKRIELSKTQISEAEQILKKYKNYESFARDKEAAYKFTNIIGVKICPYCNIEYVYTVYDDNNIPVVRPDIDHFEPKSIKPELQLELMNLILSCFICNERLKGSKAFTRNHFLHPYYDDFDSIMTFKINLNDTDYLKEEKFKISIQAKDSAKENDVKRALRNISVFKLNERYQFHKDDVVMIFKRMKNYKNGKLNEIEDLLSGGNKKTSDLRLMFPEKYCEINTTSLGKLKKDLIREYL